MTRRLPAPRSAPSLGHKELPHRPFPRWSFGLSAPIAALALLAHGCMRPAPAQTVPPACAAHLPFGAPRPSFAGDTLLCRKRLAIAHDPATKAPRWVAHAIRSSDAWACEPRDNQFRADPDLVRLKRPRATLADYAKSDWHRGHMAADADLRSDPVAAAEADYLSNVVPKSPALNIGLWARIEATVRVWAADRGEVWVLTGPVHGLTEPRWIGSGVRVPDGVFKVVIDPARRESVAFYAGNSPFPWSKDPAGFVVSLAEVEGLTGLVVPKPDGLVESAAPWPADMRTFGQAKELVCAQARQEP